MRKFPLFAVTATAIAALSVPAAAQGPKAGKGPSVHTTGATRAGGQSGSHASGPKSVSSGSGSGSSTHNTGGGAGHESHKSSHSSTTSTTTSDGSSTTTIVAVTDPNPISIKISKNPNQLARLTAMLPEGMSIEEASAGFRNQGQFIAALNASKNRGISFVDLKDAMTIDGLSLGQAVRQIQTTEAPEVTTTASTSEGSSTEGTSSEGTSSGGTSSGDSSSGSSSSSSESSSTTTTTSAAK